MMLKNTKFMTNDIIVEITVELQWLQLKFLDNISEIEPVQIKTVACNCLD